MKINVEEKRNSEEDQIKNVWKRLKKIRGLLMCVEDANDRDKWWDRMRVADPK